MTTTRDAPAPTPKHRDLRLPWSRRNALVPRVLVQPLQSFLATEAASGIALVLAALAALVWANSPFSSSYEELWTTELSLSVGGFELTEDLRHWINDLLMAVFFFVIGLEIKREVVHGELADRRRAAVPLLCALGGMAVPAAVFVAVNLGGAGAGGWGTPMATDIAFALGVLALLGPRAPSGLKVFLLTLAVADDLGAIAVIAVFYSRGLGAGWLLLAVAVVASTVVLQRARVRHLVPYVVAAGVLWLAVFESGVHATIAGVVLGLLTPAHPFQRPEAVVDDVAANIDAVRVVQGTDDEKEVDETTLRHVAGLVDEAVSPLARLEHSLHPWTSFVVLPLFALANAGLDLGGGVLGDALGEPVTLGVVAGLVLGKPLGILGGAILATRGFGLPLPSGVTWHHLVGVGLLAGIGFTVSIFIAGLAFQGDTVLETSAKLGVLAASVLAGLLGAGVLLVADRPAAAAEAAAAKAEEQSPSA